MSTYAKQNKAGHDLARGDIERGDVAWLVNRLRMMAAQDNGTAVGYLWLVATAALRARQSE